MYYKVELDFVPYNEDTENPTLYVKENELMTLINIYTRSKYEAKVSRISEEDYNNSIKTDI